jgi:hypothetical protein
MQARIGHIQDALRKLALLSIFNHQPSSARDQGMASFYKGRLSDGSGPANVSYDFRLSLFDATADPRT